jgi:hypothetical protein
MMATKTWNGSNADWYANSGADWNPAGDPAASDDVVIGSGTVTLTSGDAGISVNSITLSGTGVLQIDDPGATQSVTGNVTSAARSTSIPSAAAVWRVPLAEQQRHPQHRQ